MRTAVAIFAVTILATGCGRQPVAEPVAEIPLLQPGIPSKVAGLEGIYCTPDEISGFSGTVIEFKGNSFRYWFYTDVEGFLDTPKYPLTGEYTVQDETVVLDNETINQREWSPLVFNGIPVLLRPDAMRHWREQNRIYDYGILIKVDGKVSDDGKIARPSVKEIYDARKKDKEWKDPFVHGPQ